MSSLATATSKSPCVARPAADLPVRDACSAVYDRRRRRWRHLDLGRCRLWLVYEIRRRECPDCGVRTEELPWARPGARHTRDFEDMVLWLAQRTDRTSVATLMRCGWETVTAIINRGVAELLNTRGCRRSTASALMRSATATRTAI